MLSSSWRLLTFEDAPSRAVGQSFVIRRVSNAPIACISTTIALKGIMYLKRNKDLILADDAPVRAIVDVPGALQVHSVAMDVRGGATKRRARACIVRPLHMLPLQEPHSSADDYIAGDDKVSIASFCVFLS
jgi:hypothetical protein